MKYLALVLISIILFLQGCNAQSKIMENQNIIIPKIDNSFEKFDVDKFDLEKENIFTKENDIYIKRMNQSFGFAEHLVAENSLFSIIKLFFKNRFIKEKGISFNNGSEYGIWYEFDEQGNLIKEIDTGQGYDFSWKQVIQYCEKNNIVLTKGYETSGFQTTIYKEESEEGNKIWVITYQISGDQLIELTLDGKNGKELNRKELEFINH